MYKVRDEILMSLPDGERVRKAIARIRAEDEAKRLKEEAEEREKSEKYLRMLAKRYNKQRSKA